jgi:hypothetical protein
MQMVPNSTGGTRTTHASCHVQIIYRKMCLWEDAQMDVEATIYYIIYRQLFLVFKFVLIASMLWRIGMVKIIASPINHVKEVV